MIDVEEFWTRPEVRTLRDRADAAEVAGDQEAALAAWDELVAAHPKAIGGWSARGMFLERRGRFSDALASYRRSTQVRASYPDHYNAGTMLLSLERPEEALAEFDASIACNDRYAQAWCNRGIALTQLGSHAIAKASFERAEELDDRLANAFRCHAILLHSIGERGAAVALRKRVCELEPTSAVAHLAYAKALGDAHDDRLVHWEPGGVEEQIVAALDVALALLLDERQRRWAWAEKVLRLQRIAHGRQSARRAGANGVDDAAAIARYRDAAEAAVLIYPGDPWFADRASDARDLTP